ncbi:UNVERIFIED_CONTAM: hypothetical protein HDU68_002749 [Siphonaria sp. JEL0065]|nr:hypothetical protein HDU68_002749 [Siphonaria sp. JEL0065]
MGTIAVCSGVATVNGEQWLDGITILDGLDLISEEESSFTTSIALRIKKHKDEPELKRELLEVSATVQGMADLCAVAFADVDDAQNWIAALRNLTSMTITPNVCNLLSASIILLRTKLDDPFHEFRSLLEATPDTTCEGRLMNELETLIHTRPEFDGALFGHGFVTELQRALKAEFYDIASKHVAQNVKFTEIRQFVHPSNVHSRKEVVNEGLESFEDWVVAKIDGDETFTFKSVTGKVMGGTGEFFSVVKFSSEAEAEETAGLFSNTVNSKVTEIRLTYNPKWVDWVKK